MLQKSVKYSTINKNICTSSKINVIHMHNKGEITTFNFCFNIMMDRTMQIFTSALAQSSECAFEEGSYGWQY